MSMHYFFESRFFPEILFNFYLLIYLLEYF